MPVDGANGGGSAYRAMPSGQGSDGPTFFSESEYGTVPLSAANSGNTAELYSPLNLKKLEELIVAKKSKI
jgi:hypothetical protein